MRRQTRSFSSLKSGMPYIKQAARAIGALEDGDCVAGAVELLCGGKTRGAAADDGDAFAGAQSAAARALIQPSSKPRSAIDISICLMATGSSLMPSTQAASHGAGQTRPVNSGKLLVA